MECARRAASPARAGRARGRAGGQDRRRQHQCAYGAVAAGEGRHGGAPGGICAAAADDPREAEGVRGSHQQGEPRRGRHG